MHLRRSLSTTLTGGLVAGALVLAPSTGPALDPAYAAPITSATEVDGMVLDGPLSDAGSAAIVDDLETAEVAPGLQHLSYVRLQSEGRLAVDVLRADLADEGEAGVRADYLGPDTVSGDPRTITELTDDAGAVAGINGDFFDINNSSAPLGPVVDRDGEGPGGLVKSGNVGREMAAAFDGSGLGRVAQLVLDGQVVADGTRLDLDVVNAAQVPAGGLGLFTSAWGSYPRTRVLEPGETGVEVVVDADGTVTGVTDQVGEGPIGAGVQVLVARPGATADTLRTLEVGDEVEVAYALDAASRDVEVAVGAGETLLDDGEVVATDASLNPRTAIGFDAEGDTAYLVVVDGRTSASRGVTLPELATLMRDLGAYDAINLDGGGSSQMNLREPGATSSEVQNTPSDGYERRDANGLGLVLATPGSGRLTAYAMAPRLDERDTDDEPVRVFPGLRRTIDAAGHDETGSAVRSAVARWGTDDAGVARVWSRGVFRGVAPGTTTATASSGDATGTIDLLVLGALDRLTAGQRVIDLEARGSSAVVDLTGHDAEGFDAPVEARDVRVSNPEPDVFDVAPTADGRFEVTAIGDEGSTVLTFTAGGESVEVAVAVPLVEQVVEDFSTRTWTSAHDRAPGGSVTPGEGHEGAPSIAMSYDFTQSTGTRGQYAVAPAPGLTIPGRPQKLSVWVKGDGNGGWLRLQILQADGVRSWIDGADGASSAYVNWTGWQRVDFTVPQGFATPLLLERIRLLETVASKQYTGEVELSTVSAYLPPEDVETPATPRVTDPVVAESGATDDAPLRVAVMSDAQFVARDPDSPAVDGARETLREIVAADPDLLVINGDLVDEASPADFDLAREILDDELAGTDLPWHYLPGNHEIMGGPIQNFVDEFGPTRGTVDLDGTRLIMLDSSTGRLGSDFDQVVMLRDQLAAAADDPAITGVVVASHMPTTDPLPTASSQLSDRLEAAMVDAWLADFRATSGKSVAYVGAHVGVFDATRRDGVLHLITGNSGKSPSSTPANGGFTGWAMLGIDPDEGVRDADDEPWLEAEFETRVDPGSLDLTAPARLAVGRTGDVAAALTQDDGARTVPVAWPVSAAWGGAGVHVGAPSDAPEGTLVAVEPDTGRITALAPGTTTLTVEVNGEQASADLVVARGDLGLGDPVVRVAGVARVGRTLRAVRDGWEVPAGASVAYRWLRDGQPLPRSRARTHELKPAARGSRFSVRVIVRRSGYETVRTTSVPTAPVTR